MLQATPNFRAHTVPAVRRFARTDGQAQLHNIQKHTLSAVISLVEDTMFHLDLVPALNKMKLERGENILAFWEALLRAAAH